MSGSETIVQGILVAFALVVLTMPLFLRVLRRVGMGKRIRLDGPETHYVKEGTPTMGGLLIVGAVLLISGFLELSTGDFVDSSTFAPLATLALVGLLGTADDWLNARTGDGISGRQKLLWQSVVGGVAAWQIQDTYQITALFVPFIGTVSIPPWLYIVIAAFAIVASSNAVNITDGLDGLAGGTLIFSFIGYLIIAAVAFEQPGVDVIDPADLPLLCALIVGAILAFLWFNVHPAQIFMGDSGALALGATLAVIALITGQILLLPLIGLVFVLETGSVILQVVSVRLRGRRLFLMSPLHHHFELKGWDEEKITLRFWIVGALAALVGVAFFLGSRGPGVIASVTDATVRPIDLATLTLDSFAGRPVGVLGAARSGLALARFLAGRGAVVTLYDARPLEALAPSVAGLQGLSVRLLLGADVDPAAALAGQSLICTSPSVSSRFPTTEPRLRAALASVEVEGRVPVVSEVDLFLRLTPSATIGVTGTKGKTTTSALTAAVLAAGPEPVLLGGNIGTPLVERLPEIGPRHRVVLELSELQLPTLSRGTDVAVYTHVTSDHLDRHGSLEAYRTVKRRLAELLPPGGALVRNDEDPVVRTYEPPPGAVLVRYGRQAPVAGGVGIVEGWIVDGGVPRLRGPGTTPPAPTDRIVPLEAIRLPGEHNRSNVCAAVAVGLLYGVEPDAIAGAVSAFTGVEHRLEHAATIDGVRFVNDSQGTQPDAVIAALRSFPRPLVLIAGGRSKGVAIEDLSRVVAERASAAVLIGETADELARAFRAAGLPATERARSMDEAVRVADAIARDLRAGTDAVGAEEPLATVLLSPAAASFDMFTDYEARGAAFKAAVARLAEDRAGAGGAR